MAGQTEDTRLEGLMTMRYTSAWMIGLGALLLATSHAASQDGKKESEAGDGSNVAAVGTLELTLATNKRVFKVGEHPTFAAVMKNVSQGDVYVMGCLDGSESGRYPRYEAVATVDSNPVQIEEFGRCGNMNALQTQDFKRLKPGESFDPFGAGYFQSYYLTSAFKFDKPGTYEVKLVYDTNASEDEQFLGEPDRLGRTLILALRSLLRIRVSSNVVTFTVK
jgi:hypothetical protein